MKKLFKIIGILAVIIGLLMSVGAAMRNFDDAGEASEYATELNKGAAQLETLKEQNKMMDGPEKELMLQDIKNAEQAMKDVPTRNTLLIAGVLCGVLAILLVIIAVLLFKPSNKATIIMISTIVVGVALVMISPDPKGSMTSGASNRVLAIIAAVPAIVSAICAYMFAKKSDAI